MNIPDIRRLVKYTLKGIGMYSKEAESLIMGTGAVESRYNYLYQIKGPARSFWQVEPSTAYDNMQNYLIYRHHIWEKVARICVLPEELITNNTEDDMRIILSLNMAFAICMCRIKYRRDKYPLPRDINGQAEYWLRVYNAGGKGSVKKYVEAYSIIKRTKR